MKKAFTLIELLVVIAIIAILAAILFPVFAQAKDSAKDTTALSNVKQMGTSMLLYSTDADDLFPPMVTANSSGWDTWQGLTQPYTKTWDLQIHPKMPRPTGERAYWQRLQHWGALPRAVAVQGDPAEYFEWTEGTLTGGQRVRFDGVLGAAIERNGWYSMQPAPSLSQSQIEGISDTMLITEANQFDLWWGIYPKPFQMGYCQSWGGDWDAPGKTTIFGPHARKRNQAATSGCVWPKGMTIYAATDGSAKALDYRGKILERRQRADGTWIHPRMWTGALN